MTERLGTDSNNFEISFELPIRDGALELADLPVAAANLWLSGAVLLKLLMMGHPDRKACEKVLE